MGETFEENVELLTPDEFSDPKIIEILQNEDVVNGVINAIVYNIELPDGRNGLDYFLNGYCYLLARMLTELFGSYAVAYNSWDRGHVVTKIGENYYDAEGFIGGKKFEDLNIDLDFLPISNEELYDLPTYGGALPSKWRQLEENEIVERGVKIGIKQLRESINRNLGRVSRHSL